MGHLGSKYGPKKDQKKGNFDQIIYKINIFFVHSNSAHGEDFWELSWVIKAPKQTEDKNICSKLSVLTLNQP